MTRPERLTQALSTVEKLRTRVSNLQGEVDGATQGKQKKLVAKLDDRLQQKMTDTHMSEDACLSQMAIDFLGDNKSVLEAAPEKASPEKIFEIVVMAKYYLDRNGGIKGWKDHEAGIEKWATYLQQRVNAGSKE